MIKETCFCDRCGSKMSFDIDRRLRVFAKRRYLIRFNKNWKGLFPDEVSFDLCEKCRKILEVWLDEKRA